MKEYNFFLNKNMSVYEVDLKFILLIIYVLKLK